MKLKDIKGKDSKELLGDLQTLEKEAWQLRFNRGDDADNPSRPHQVRRTIARIKTILRERELAQKAKGKSS